MLVPLHTYQKKKMLVPLHHMLDEQILRTIANDSCWCLGMYKNVKQLLHLRETVDC